MAKGFSFAQRARDARPQYNSAWAGKLIFGLGDGEHAIVRFLEQEDEVIWGAWHHEIPVEGRSWGYDVLCLAQDDEGNRTDDACPGCEQDLKLKEKYFVKLLWKDGPVYKKDDDGKLVKDNFDNPKIIGEEDQIAVWASGPRLAENLEEIEENYGLTTRYYKVKRKGLKTKTKYTIVPHPVDGKEADRKLSKEDAALINADADDTDLNDFMDIGTYEDFEKRLSGNFDAKGDSDDDDDEPGTKNKDTETAQRRNPFKR